EARRGAGTFSGSSAARGLRGGLPIGGGTAAVAARANGPRRAGGWAAAS
ncbi:MAG: hypothetical protein JSR72_00035, partial [Proteobacteria bacterium]|nr:hypothetical protein [Pseudomonadota bacterium]